MSIVDPLEVKSMCNQKFWAVLFEKVAHNQYNPVTSNTNQFDKSIQINSNPATEIVLIPMKEKQTLPRFEFENFDTFVLDLDGLSLSDVDSFCSPPPLPLTYLQSSPVQYEEEKHTILEKTKERTLPRFEFDNPDTFIFDVDELSLSDVESFCSPPPLPLSVVRPPLDHLNKQNASKPQLHKDELCDIFGVTDSHQQYQHYHLKARIRYAKKLKEASKIEKNPMNYFLLPILLDWDHTIGSKIGKRDYGFHSGLNSKNMCRVRDDNDFHGVDFEVKEKDHNKSNKPAKTAKQVVIEVMQAKKMFNNLDYCYKEISIYPQGFRYQFVLKEQLVAEGYGKSIKDAKQECSRNVIHQFKSLPEFSECVHRIELGIKPAKNYTHPVGYEYPVQLYDPMFGRRYRYEFVSWHPQHQVPLQQSYNYNNVTVFEDRGLLDNPSVEKMYFQQWGTFKGKGNIPVHCHEYLNSNRRFIKPFKDETERRIWKAIWQAYEPKPNNDCDKGAPHADLRSAQDEHELIIYSKDKANAPFTHCLMFDFDGTVYAQQLRHLWKEQNKLDGITMMQYINVLIAEDQVINGFGGLERTKALKELFQILRKYKGRLCVAMSTFQVKEDINLQPLFDVMDVNMDEWFDVIVDAHHVIGKKLFADKHNTQVNHRHWKDRMISKFCDIYGIPRENVLYVDDDRKIKRKVVCCEVFQAQNRGKGLTPEEMKAIVTNVQQKWFPAKQDIELNEEKN
eukprot:232758_1